MAWTTKLHASNRLTDSAESAAAKLAASVRVLSVVLLGVTVWFSITDAARAAPVFHARSQNVAVIPNSTNGSAGALPTSGSVLGVPGASFDEFTFKNLAVADINASQLAQFDTAVLYQVSTVELDDAARQALNNFVLDGGKLLIHDSDSTTANDYSWLAASARTGTSCPNCGATSGSSRIVEHNTMVSDDPASPAYVNVSELEGVTDAVGDANVMVSQDTRWFQDIQATNSLGQAGAVHTYASVGGLIVYNGYDTDNIGVPGASGVDWLGKLVYLELAQAWSPDGLPHGTPVAPPPPLPPLAPAPPPPVAAPPTPSPPTPVVLIPGLNEGTTGVSGALSPRDCPSELDHKHNEFRALCLHLTSLGVPVYVVSSAKGGAAAELDNQAPIDRNARALLNYLRRTFPPGLTSRAPLLVGHSMGGLIARVAISRYAAPASGLFTIGTPHSGSFWSDALALSLSLRCLHPACLAVRAAAQVIAATKGRAAILDMTLTARGIDNLGLRPPGVPTWVYAGTAVHGLDPTGYVAPNDEAVGRTSALGRSANLANPTPYEADLWHNRETALGISHPNNEFEDLRVLDRVSSAAMGTTRAGARTLRSQFAVVHRLSAVASAAEPSTVRITLTRQQASRTRAGQPVRLPHPLQSVLGREAFSVSCGRRTAAALPIGPDLYFLPRDAADCPHPTLDAARAVSVVVNVDDLRVRARVSRLAGGRLRIDVTGARQLRGASIHVNHRTIKGRRSRGTYRLVLPPPRHELSGIVTARVDGHTYRAALQVPAA
jgi:pimeloyl-ACP methyl ester carboxylesterase